MVVELDRRVREILRRYGLLKSISTTEIEEGVVLVFELVALLGADCETANNILRIGVEFEEELRNREDT